MAHEPLKSKAARKKASYPHARPLTASSSSRGHQLHYGKHQLLYGKHQLPLIHCRNACPPTTSVKPSRLLLLRSSAQHLLHSHSKSSWCNRTSRRGDASPSAAVAVPRSSASSSALQPSRAELPPPSSSSSLGRRGPVGGLNWSKRMLTVAAKLAQRRRDRAESMWVSYAPLAPRYLAWCSSPAAQPVFHFGGNTPMKLAYLREVTCQGI